MNIVITHTSEMERCWISSLSLLEPLDPTACKSEVCQCHRQVDSRGQDATSDAVMGAHGGFSC